MGPQRKDTFQYNVKHPQKQRHILTECRAIGFMKLFYVVPTDRHTAVASYQMHLN